MRWTGKILGFCCLGEVGDGISIAGAKRGLGFKDNGVQDTGRAILKEKSRLERFRFGV